MIGKRTKLDFSAHELRITQQEGLLVHYLRKPDTVCNSIKYINTNGIMAVTGDYGNWIFCREFHPSANGGASDGYWAEKLKIASTQNAKTWSAEETEKQLKCELAAYLLEYKDDVDASYLDYYEECLRRLEDGQAAYEAYAYLETPKDFDHEYVVSEYEYHVWFKYIMDGFDEICRRLKEQENKALQENADTLTTAAGIINNKSKIR